MVFDVYFSLSLAKCRGKSGPKCCLAASQLYRFRWRLKKFYRKKRHLSWNISEAIFLEVFRLKLRNKAATWRAKKKIKIKGKIGHHEELMQTVLAWRMRRDKIALKLAAFLRGKQQRKNCAQSEKRSLPNLKTHLFSFMHLIFYFTEIYFISLRFSGWNVRLPLFSLLFSSRNNVER